MSKRMTRSQRKEMILDVLRSNAATGGNPMSCRQIAQEMGLTGYSYVNSLLIEMADVGDVGVNVEPANTFHNVVFKYYI